MWRLLVGAGILLAVAAFLLNTGMERRSRQEFDSALEDRARAFASLAEQDQGRIWVEFEPFDHPEFLPGAAAEYFEVRGPEGDTVLLSESAGGQRLPFRGVLENGSGPRFANVNLPDGRQGRSVSFRFTPRIELESESLEDERAKGSPSATGEPASSPVLAFAAPAVEAEILVARERESLERFLARLRSSILSFCISLLVALAALIGWTLRRELAPVKRLASELDQMDSRSLDQPLEETGLPSELAPVAARLNDLLARLHVSFERERSFSSQLAHELRTPLAELRVAVEVGLRWSDDPQDLSAALEEAGDVGRQMERLVANLMALARADAGIESLAATPIALASAVDEALARSSRTLEARRIEVRNRIHREIRVMVPAPALELALTNLAVNAASYALEGSWVEITFDDRARILLWRNPVTELVSTDLEQMFDRFWRKSEARSFGEHAGLGLTLVRSMARRLGGEASARLEDGTLVVEFSGFR